MPAFQPLVGKSPEILILGSMPGRASLAVDQYYAHPRNAFWWIIANLFDFSHRAEYQHKVANLINKGVAVWDVLHDCQRRGSADAEIVRASEQPNDFKTFLHQYPSLKLIAFNGATAEALFMRHCRELNLESSPDRVRLPSTSPAYAAMPRSEKLHIWRHHLLPYSSYLND